MADKDPGAVELGRRGGRAGTGACKIKGGKARWKGVPRKARTAHYSAAASSYWSRLSPEERSTIMRARARKRAENRDASKADVIKP